MLTTLLRRTGRLVLLPALALQVTGCDLDELVEVDLPVIAPTNAANAAGAGALRVAAWRDLWQFTGFNVLAWAGSGLLSDELINGRSGFELTDQRDPSLTSSPASSSWSGYVAVLHSAPKAIRALTAYLPDNATRAGYIAELEAILGLTKTIGGEIFCNGIPRSTLNDDGTKEYDTKSYTNIDLWNEAIAHFDAALATAPATNTIRNMARIGKARALLNLNRPADAAAVVRAGGGGAGSAAVATNYTFFAEYTASGTVTQGPYEWVPGSWNMGLPNGPETPHSMDYSTDPRIGMVFGRLGQDGVTPLYNPKAVAWMQQDAGADMPLATGVEARLIEAEADMRAGNPAWLTTLNTLRSGSTFAAQLPALVDPGTEAARVDMLMKERAMWMYLTIHRLGDLRRLVRQYGRAVNSTFPSGPYFKGGTYSTAVSLMPTLTESQTHPHWQACTDFNP